MLLPVSSPAAAAWSVWDYSEKIATTDVPGDGSASVPAVIGEVPQGDLWLVDRIVVSTSPDDELTTARLYVDYVDQGHLIDGTRSGGFDVADNASPMQLREGTSLLCVWQDAQNPALATIRVQLTILRQLSPA